ncbi:MAG: acylneuraminate cytidylyltransferase family protein [Candidatus Thiodiazotropha sp.]
MSALNLAAYAVIPARGGSSGVKKKNIRELCGRPLISYIIAAAKKAELIDKVFVSTEDKDISQVAEKWGAEVISHDPALSGDESPSFFVIQNATKILATRGDSPDIVVTLRATSPLCPASAIDEAVRVVTMNSNASSALSVVRAQVHPDKVLQIGKTGYLEYYNSNTSERQYPKRRQEFGEVYVRNAAIYATRTEVIEQGSIWGNSPVPVIMSKENSVNINEEIDFVLAEALLRKNPD